MSVYVQDTDFTLYHGDALDVLRELPAVSVHCCVTSPPYWSLRDYGSPDQLGLESTPDEYVARMVEVFREVRRVLRADGTLWLNLGDSYIAGQGGRQSSVGEMPAGTLRKTNVPRDRDDVDTGAWGARDVTSKTTPARGTTDLKPKDLAGIPWMIAFALRADGWWLRSDIIWSKPNPMPESVTDRPTKAHEYVFLLSKSARYFFDQEAVREPHSFTSWTANGDLAGTTRKGRHETPPKGGQHRGRQDAGTMQGASYHPGGRNVRSVWEIATQPYAEAHFATFPQELPRRCIRASTSEHGCCPECGAPWERLVEIERGQIDRIRNVGGRTDGFTTTRRPPGASDEDMASKRTTLDWAPSCDHAHDPVSCTVLDPFMGSGTTALVARNLGRRSIGIELNADYCALAAQRLNQQSLLTGDAA